MIWKLIIPIGVLLCSCSPKEKTKVENIEQGRSIDSRQNFSYFMFGVQGNSISRGTFFLFSHNNKTYFITAAHVMTGWNSFKGYQEAISPDTFYLRFYHKDGSIKIYQTNVAQFKKSYPHAFFYSHADLFVAEVSLDPELIINTISVSPAIKYNIINPESGFAYGFPVSTNSVLDSIVRESQTKMQGLITADIHKAIYFKEKNITDTINYYLDALGSGGFSGSPVFLQDKDSEPYFGGVCIGGSLSSKTAYVIRPDVVINTVANNKDRLTIKFLMSK
jgi:hypothetical protein